MRKSILSKISGYSSILNSASPDQNLQILRISLKKQLDRKQKLQRLMQKYQQITIQQKSHIKSIKSNIIELKDLQSNCKTKFYLNPIIYVDNNLNKDTREYLCMLLNTFYSKYDQNSQCQFKTKALGTDMNQLLQSISKNQENLLKIQKQTIGVQVQLEGELLGYKTRLKDQTQRQKQLQQENKRVSGICAQYEDKYKQQLLKVQKLRTNCQQIQDKICKLKQKLAQGQLVKKGKQKMMANQIAYQQKFKIQLGTCDEDIQKENQKEKILKLKIKQKKLKVEQLKGKYNKMLQLAQTMMGIDNSSQIVDPVIINARSNTQSHISLNQIKKYEGLLNSINSTLQMSNSMFGQNVKSKDRINYELGMKIIEMKNEDISDKKKQRMSVR